MKYSNKIDADSKSEHSRGAGGISFSSLAFCKTGEKPMLPWVSRNVHACPICVCLLQGSRTNQVIGKSDFYATCRLQTPVLLQYCSHNKCNLGIWCNLTKPFTTTTLAFPVGKQLLNNLINTHTHRLNVCCLYI